MTQTELDQIAERVANVVAAKLSTAPLFIDKFELSRRTPLSVSTIERRVKDGSLPAVKIGRRLMFSPDAVVAALTKSEEAPTGT